MPRAIIRILAYVALFAVLLFSPAGTFAWPRAWIFLLLLLVVRVVGTISIHRVNPAVLKERAGPPIRKGQPLADRILVPLFMATYAALVWFVSYDVHRLHSLPHTGSAVAGAGLLLFAVGWWIVTVVLRTNAFASIVVRHQPEHAVVDHGPYRFVRHPMYSGVILAIVGMCLWLGSFAAALATMIPAGILAVRIVFEERFLAGNLSGYPEYARRVRWRLLPGIW